MLQQRSVILIALAILLGLAAVFVTNAFLSGVQKQQEVIPTGTAKVVVARVPLEFGTKITADMVRVVDLPVSAIPEGVFASANQFLSGGQPRVALRQITVNEPLLRNAVSGAGGRAGIANVLTNGMRAVAVRVTDTAGVAGFVLPGDIVDVMVTRSIGNGSGRDRQITDVLLQKARVIAIDQNANQTSDQPAIGKTATLEVTQVDAQKLALGQQVGTLFLALRRVEDIDETLVSTVGMDDLRASAYGGGYISPGPKYRPSFYDVDGGQMAAAMAALQPRPAAPAPAPAPRSNGNPGAVAPRRLTGPTVEIIRGTTGTQYEVGGYGRY